MYISHLRLCVDIGSISDQLLDNFCLASQRGYVQSSVSFLDYMEQRQECVLSSVPPVPMLCVCDRFTCVPQSVHISMLVSMCPSESPNTSHSLIPLVFQLWHSPPLPALPTMCHFRCPVSHTLMSPRCDWDINKTTGGFFMNFCRPL